jgi:hypothetical protein
VSQRRKPQSGKGNVIADNGWVDGIQYVQQSAGPKYVLLRTMSMRDTILHVHIGAEELFGVYAGITVRKIVDGAQASLDIEVSDNKRVSIPARVVSAGGCRHMLLLADSVKTFEILGSLSEKIADRRRGAGENRLIKNYAGT